MSSIPNEVAEALGDRYRVLRPLARGATSQVYLAEDLRYGSNVAVKVLDSEIAREVGASRFLREIKVTAKLSHPHILPLLDSGTIGESPYLVVPFIPQGSLRNRLDREPQLPIPEALRLATEIADALDFASANGVVHRDVKPENVLLAHGHAVVSDFGIARLMGEGPALTRTGIAVGTPPYMSPEQASGSSVPDGRSDQYSLACLLYEMLAGQPPFTGPTAESLVRQHCMADPPSIYALRSKVPPALERALKTALSKTPADRFESSSAFLRAASGTSQEPAVSRRLRPRTVAGVVAAGVLAIAGVLWLRGVQVGPNSGFTTLAVLPFENLGAATDDYYAEGVTEDVSTALSEIDGLQIAPRSAVSTLRGKDAPLQSMAESLNVQALLTGSIRRTGDHVELKVALREPKRRQPVWEESFEAAPSEAHRLRFQVAEAVAARFLRGRRSATSTNSGRKDLAEVDPRAYEAYLRGRYHWNRRTQQDMERAIDFFSRASVLEPDFGDAFAGLALTYAVMGKNENLPARDAFPAAKDAARRATELNPALADAHLALAIASLEFDWDWTAADAEFRKALALAPRDAAMHQWYAMFLESQRDFEGSLREIEIARDLEPASPIILSNVARRYAYAGDFRRAEAMIRRVLELQPDFRFAQTTHQEILRMQGRYRESVEWMDVYDRRGSGKVNEFTARLREGVRTGGSRGYWRALLAYLGTLDDPTGTEAAMARAYAQLGDQESTFVWLRRAKNDRHPSLTLLRVDPLWNPVRSDPRFQEIIRQIGIPDRGKT